MRLGHRASGSRSDNHIPRRPSADVTGSGIHYTDQLNNGNHTAHAPISIMHAQQNPAPGYGNGNGFATARSPPKAKSTSHVPCKFYPMGQCQAGSACQFSHDMDPTTQNAPCKYFSRGSCKFGQSCALKHILPDGRVINRNPRGASAAFSRRGNQSALFAAVSTTPLAIVTQDQAIPPEFAGYPVQEPVSTYIPQPNSPSFRTDIYPSNSSSPYGSPHNDLLQPRSPPRPGLSARDAQLPSSWDSQGVSQAARNGPYAASVPGRFGLESPSASYPAMQLGTTHHPTATLDTVLHGLGSSPREVEQLSFAKRPLHSERFARRPPVSSSLDFRGFYPSDPIPTNTSSDADLEAASSSSEGAGEDLLPSSLHDLIPVDKLRRSSRSAATTDEDSSYWGATQRRMGSVSGTSPHAGSPSRYSAMWAARSSTKAENETSAFGHVGSPLRPSNLRTSSTSEGMSMLTSQLRGVAVDDKPGFLRSTTEKDRDDVTPLKSGDDEGMFSMEDEEPAHGPPKTWAMAAAAPSSGPDAASGTGKK